VKATRQIVLIAHNLRSSHNVGSLLRTADGLGVNQVILSGYTQYPAAVNDSRLPHLAAKASRAIHKTALGAEATVNWKHYTAVDQAINDLKNQGFEIWALEQASGSILLPSFDPPLKCALIIGREVEGIETEIITMADGCIEIPMYGKKESFNVAQAAAIAMYHCLFFRS
jgi:23S rRNA (guanosine2251-2'-O)-methyltransferase